MTNDTTGAVARTHYLTVAEVAEDLRVAPMTVYRMIHAGALKAHRLGHRTYRIPASEYADYKQQLEHDATARQQRSTTPPVPHIPGQTSLPAATDGLAAL